MIILLNTIGVCNEVLEWATFRMANILRVPPASIHAEWMRNKRGNLDASFSLDADLASGVHEDQVREVVQMVWGTEARPMLDERLAGVRMRRNG